MWIIIDDATGEKLYTKAGQLVEFETEDVAEQYANSLPPTRIAWGQGNYTKHGYHTEPKE